VEEKGEEAEGTYISDTCHASAFEFAAIELLDGGAEVGCRFELDESACCQPLMNGRSGDMKAHPLPSRSRPVSE
jgi:hypothetical protein